jgi:hypothetical protein
VRPSTDVIVPIGIGWTLGELQTGLEARVPDDQAASARRTF